MNKPAWDAVTCISLSLGTLALFAALAYSTPAHAPEKPQEAPQSQNYTATHTETATASYGAYTATEGYDYTISVNQAGGQSAIDTCTGPVWADYGQYGVSIAEHNYCGGAPVLDLQVGDTINSVGTYGTGLWTVTELKDVPKKGTPVSVLEGGVWLQTCHWGDKDMRIARIERTN